MMNRVSDDTIMAFTSLLIYEVDKYNYGTCETSKRDGDMVNFAVKNRDTDAVVTLRIWNDQLDKSVRDGKLIHTIRRLLENELKPKSSRSNGNSITLD
jgi:hypothetical protein